MKRISLIALSLLVQQATTQAQEQKAQSRANVQIIEITPGQAAGDTQSFSFSIDGADDAVVKSATTVKTHTTMSKQTEYGTVTASSGDDANTKNVKITDQDDNVVFEGAITAEEIDQVPEQFRETTKSLFNNSAVQLKMLDAHALNAGSPDLSKAIADMLQNLDTNALQGATIGNISDITATLGPEIQQAVAGIVAAAQASGAQAALLAGEPNTDMQKEIEKLMAAARQQGGAQVQNDQSDVQVGAVTMTINASSFSSSGGGVGQQMAASYSMTTKDGTINVKPTDEDGVKDVLIKNTDGEVVFEGAISQAEIDQVPEAYRDTTENLLAGNMFNIQINGIGGTLDDAAPADAPKAEKDISDLLKDAGGR